MDAMKVRTTLTEFDDLHQRVDKARGRAVTVPKDVLLRLLTDHSLLVGKLNDMGVTVTDGMNEAPLPPRARRRPQ